MENTGKINPLDIKIQGLLDRYLKISSADNDTSTNQNHLDEDTLSAFVEGNLREREAKPVVSHLVECSFCRDITTQLVRLDLAFAGETENIPVTENQPTKIADVLSGILSRIFGTNEGAVFAHHEEESQNSNEDEKREKKD